MSGWTAIVPMKAVGKRKTRLAGHLSGAGREELSENLFYHVISTLKSAAGVARIIILSDGPVLMAGYDWIVDGGTGLNPELERTRALAGAGPQLIIHADLPLLDVADIDALLAAGADGIALAPDSAGTGTNAIALGRTGGRAGDFKLCFGPGSFARHLAQAPEAAIVRRAGLGLDVDTADDLDEAIRRGFSDQ